MSSPADQTMRQASYKSLPTGLLDPWLRVAVLAAHPDDEAIGASVLLARCESPLVIFLTDGAPHDSRLWPPDFKGSRIEYAELRRREARRALSWAGVSPEQVCWLGAADQDAIFSASELAARLSQVLEQASLAVLVSHPYEGGHPDHDTAALIAQLVRVRLRRRNPPALLEMTSYHARHGRCVNGEFLNPSPAETRFQLSEADRERKQKMFEAYVSQHLILESFGTTEERWRQAPEYDFSRPPHDGKLWYECLGWPMTGERWRALAIQSVAKVEECACR
jgi:LmbE family N-acetylglucosaminyl deacetylase